MFRRQNLTLLTLVFKGSDVRCLLRNWCTGAIWMPFLLHQWLML